MPPSARPLLRHTTTTIRSPSSPAAPRPRAEWRAVWWFGLLLAAVGLADAALNWYPLGLGQPEWEFGVAAMTLAGLPLPTVGLAAMLASATAQAQRRRTLAMAWLFLALAVGIAAVYGLFLLVVPIALHSQGAVAKVVVKKTIAKTSVMALGFAVAYLSASIAAFRRGRSTRRA